MPRLSMTDEYGNTEEFNTARRPRGGRGFFVAFLLILSFVMGVLGGVVGVITITNNETFKRQLGLAALPTLDLSARKEKIVLEESSAVIDTVKKVSPAVVSIFVSQDVRDFFGSIVGTQQAGGTGFILTSDGIIITNKHVAADTAATYSVFTSEGKEYQGKVLSLDPYTDLAILKIEASGLPVVELGDSEIVQVGQSVVAIGNALGEFKNTVTLGIVSAKDRKIQASDQSGNSGETLEGLLQTDAAINAGNSGGPLVNLKGQVVGINTAVAAKGVAEGIGFAIPINTAKSAIESVRKTGKIVRAKMGVRYITVTKEVAAKGNLSVDYGALIYSGEAGQPAVEPNGPADKANLQENDIITAINGDRIDSEHSLSSRIQNYQPGDKVTVTVRRGDKDLKIEVTLGSSD